MTKLRIERFHVKTSNVYWKKKNTREIVVSNFEWSRNVLLVEIRLCMRFDLGRSEFYRLHLTRVPCPIPWHEDIRVARHLWLKTIPFDVLRHRLGNVHVYRKPCKREPEHWFPSIKYFITYVGREASHAYIVRHQIDVRRDRSTVTKDFILRSSRP